MFLTHCWAILSNKFVMPNGRIFPLLFGIITRLAFPCFEPNNRFLISFITTSISSFIMSLNVNPSGPAVFLPLLLPIILIEQIIFLSSMTYCHKWLNRVFINALSNNICSISLRPYRQISFSLTFNRIALFPHGIAITIDVRLGAFPPPPLQKLPQYYAPTDSPIHALSCNLQSPSDY